MTYTRSVSLIKRATDVYDLMCNQLSSLCVQQVWVSSPHNATGYYTVYGEEALHADHFNTKLSFGDTQTIWARTGYLGFLRRTELTDASGGESPQSSIGVRALLLV